MTDKPKAILFDIGGVCVISPMSAIVDYETQNGIPRDYINYAISRNAPDGAFHRLERGEIQLDDAFFAKFKSDLHRPELWESYHRQFAKLRQQRSLADSAKANASRLGDPVSLKAETSGRVPTPGEAGAAPSVTLATNARSGDSGSGSGSASGSGGNSLKESYQRNMLGDPTSLTNEGSGAEPVGRADQATGYEKDGRSGYENAAGVGGASQSGASREGGEGGGSSLKESYKKNMLGDPTSLKSEGSSREPIPEEQGAGPRDSAPSRSSGSSGSGNSLKESYQKNMLGDPTSLKSEGSSSSPVPDQQDTGYSKSTSSSSSSPSSSTTISPLPTMDTTALFWNMMSVSRAPDPHMYPALQKLRRSQEFVLGALSNTVIFPPDHEYAKDAAENPDHITRQFDVFVSSAHVGLRKPDPAIYRMAVDRLDKHDRSRGGGGIAAGQVCFLDDIGQNLKAAREVGMRTIKVNLGRVDEAVKELENVTGLQLAGGQSKL